MDFWSPSDRNAIPKYQAQSCKDNEKSVNNNLDWKEIECLLSLRLSSLNQKCRQKGSTSNFTTTK